MRLSRNKLVSTVFAVWLLFTTAGAIALIGPHFTAQKTRRLYGLEASSAFEVHHFLSMQCGCSKKILAHLLDRKLSPGAGAETIHLVDATDEMKLKLEAAGFRVTGLSEQDAVERYGLEILPQLVVMRGAAMAYQGGYARDQMHAVVFEDEKIIADVKAGQSVKDYAVFGCANGNLRKNLVDFLGVKYGKSIGL